MRQDWPYCMKCSQVFRKGYLCFWSDGVLISCTFHRTVLVCIKASIFSWFNISTGSFSEVVCKIAKKNVCIGLSTNCVHPCLTFNYCYYKIPPASKIAAISDLLSHWYLKINDMHSSLSFYHDELPCWLNVFQNVHGEPLFSDVCKVT